MKKMQQVNATTTQLMKSLDATAQTHILKKYSRSIGKG